MTVCECPVSEPVHGPSQGHMNHGMNTHNLNMHNNLRKAHFNQSFRSVLQRLLAKGGDFAYLGYCQPFLNEMLGHVLYMVCSVTYENENKNIY